MFVLMFVLIFRAELAAAYVTDFEPINYGLIYKLWKTLGKLQTGILLVLFYKRYSVDVIEMHLYQERKTELSEDTPTSDGTGNDPSVNTQEASLKIPQSAKQKKKKNSRKNIFTFISFTPKILLFHGHLYSYTSFHMRYFFITKSF